MKLLKLIAVAALAIPAVSYAACPTSLTGGYSWERYSTEPNGKTQVEIGSVTFTAPSKNSGGLGSYRTNFTLEVTSEKKTSPGITDFEFNDSPITNGKYYLDTSCRGMGWHFDSDDEVWTTLFFVVSDSGRFISLLNGPDLPKANEPSRDTAISMITNKSKYLLTEATDLGIIKLTKQ